MIAVAQIRTTEEGRPKVAPKHPASGVFAFLLGLLATVATGALATRAAATEIDHPAPGYREHQHLTAASLQLFREGDQSLFDLYDSWRGRRPDRESGATALVSREPGVRFPGDLTTAQWPADRPCDLYRLAATDHEPIMPPGTYGGPGPYASPSTEPEAPSYGRMFFKGWALITSVEMVLLVVTAMLPKSWTGWSSQFVRDGWENMKEAYTMPPVWDTDHWFHNYIGHPYGGSVYYNTVRCQGANPGQSFLFSTALSIQWEYIFEAVAERPSIQDLFITPIAGSLLGEFVHHLTLSLKRHGTNIFEKVIITILNPGSVVFNGYS